MSSVQLAATQMTCSWDRGENLKKAEYFDLATALEENPAVRHFQGIARELEVVLPIPFFERAGNAYFNSVAVIDADGEVLGVYRKTHIPDSPGYLEKYYFSPGDTGYRVWPTRYAKIGIGICWDQWFPEAARAMALMGAEIVFYPSAIGSVPTAPGFDSAPAWQRVMQGHAVANLMAVAACNRIGVERIDDSEITWFGSSFITDPLGEKLAEADRSSEGVILADIDLDLLRLTRNGFLFFRDRRPETYAPLLSLTGEAPR